MIISHHGYTLKVEFLKYQNGQSCIRLYDTADGFPYATATVATEKKLLKEDEVAIKNYSENEGILETLIENNIVERPRAFIQSGFVKIPICKKGPAFQE